MTQPSGELLGSNPLEVLSLLYEENGRVIATFWEWRHKVILLLGATLTTMVLVITWMYERRLGVALALPFAFGSLVANTCRIFDRRNFEIVDQCFKTAEDIEAQFKDSSGKIPVGTYSRVLKTRLKGRTYTDMLRFGYSAMAIGLASCAAVVVILGVLDSHVLYPHHH